MEFIIRTHNKQANKHNAKSFGLGYLIEIYLNKGKV